MQLAVILGIVLFHEMGHYLTARLFGWRIGTIMLWVFGGVMDTDEHGNRPIREEALVTAAGPAQHLIIWLALTLLPVEAWFPPSVIEVIFYYNTVILLFNLLPIWPLDGGKLLFLGLSAFMPYKKAYHSVLLFSMTASVGLLLGQLLFYPFTLSAFFVMIFLFMENKTEWKQRYYVFIRFLLKRYEGNAPVRQVRPITVPSDSSLMEVFSRFMRDKKHPIYVTFPDRTRQAIDEADCLRGYFHERHYRHAIGELLSSRL